MLEIIEIFGPTIQGEGKKIGTPSLFIRFGKCNMRCPGFGVEYETPSGTKKYSCDSFHAVDQAFKSQWNQYHSYTSVLEDLQKFLPENYQPDIVITGGEPLLYWNNEEFQKLLHYFDSKGFCVTIETNASLAIDFQHSYQKNILFSMSVKLSNSKEPFKKRVNIPTIEAIAKNTPDSYLKFVIEKSFLEKAKEEIDTITRQLPPIDIYVMPMGDSAWSIQENSEAVITMAIDNGFCYSDRLHIRVWDNKRGV